MVDVIWIIKWFHMIWLGLNRVQSRRSLRTKADDPQKDQSRRSRSKADDPWFKADDPSQSRRSSSKRRFYRVKADDPWAKADDLGPKQTIHDGPWVIGRTSLPNLNFHKMHPNLNLTLTLILP